MMIEITKLNFSTVYFFKDQKNPGRCVVAYKEHYRELYEIPEADCMNYIKEVRIVAQAINEIYHPDKLNYAIYGDGVPHVHFHLVPKYKGGISWGEPFNDKLPVFHLDEQEYATNIQLLKQQICKIMEA
jgi:diadenosine tetraphosphate (Ap4A) HIT family hydrolase